MPEGARNGSSSQTAAYWRRHLVCRRHVDEGRAASAAEWFARIEHDGEWAFFPLGSARAAEAALRAAEIHRDVVRAGWSAVRRRYVREFTLAIFWLPNPLAGTYATVFTRPENDLRARTNSREGEIAVAVIEPADEIRAAVCALVNATSEFRCVAATKTARELAGFGGEVQLILFNQHASPAIRDDVDALVRGRFRVARAVSHGIYRNSDELFVTITGVDGGYFLRRRRPVQLLDPAARAFADQSFDAAVRKYFSGLLEGPREREKGGADRMLTNREYEILSCLSRGVTSNKAIADALRISVWTVSTHLKSIFRKLDAHSRTEAVMKFVQR